MRTLAWTLMCLLGAQPTLAAERPMSPEPRTVSTTGDAQIRVPPDEVSIGLGVETFDKDLGKAKKDVDERVKRIIVAAKAAGAEEQRIATEQISIEPHYGSSSFSSRPSSDGYFVRRGMQLTLRGLSRFDAVLTAVVEAGANAVQGIQFTTTELRKHRDQARELAVKAAAEKAALLAKALGVKLGKPRSISEGGGGWFSGYGGFGGRSGMAQNVSQNAGPTAGVEGTLAPGLISVTAQVSVVFELE